MKQFLENFYVEEKFVKKLIYFFGITGSVVIGLFSVINYFLLGNYILAYFEFISSLFLVIAVFYLRTTQDIRISSYMLITIFASLLIVLIFLGGINKTGIIWLALFPFQVFLFRPLKEASIIVGVFGMLLVFILTFQLVGIISTAYKSSTLSMHILFYFITSIFAFFYKKILTNTHLSMLSLIARDPLTGLFNRNFIFDILKTESSRLKRKSINNICIIFIDLDRFKKINDTLGHEMGDYVLKKVAGFFLKNTRKEDYVARIGGDEFLFLSVNCSKKDLNKKFEKLIEDFEKEFNQYNLSFSYGLVVIPTDEESAVKALNLADKKMYSMKKKKKGEEPLSQLSTV